MTYKDFIPYFNKEIRVFDNRSVVMPTKFIGTIVGIRLDSVEIRSNNVMTNWYPINSVRVSFEFIR